MGIPTSDGPDFIINRLRDDVTLPCTRPIAGAVVGLWLLFVVVPYVFADDPSLAMLIRWSVIALIALLLTFVLPSLMGHERHRASIGTATVAAATIALVWISTA